ncbi:MAG: asparagine synthetase B family protein, partial [Terriglobales bacterium]
LQTVEDFPGPPQPASLDGEVWITADARIDARQELLEKLASKGGAPPRDTGDAGLVLLAYQAWSEQCLEHLRGDFAFAIWDGRRRRLFCARDHFGVKPFYYAHRDSCLLLGNTLDCLRLHPAISGRLNEQAIADFLLVDFNCEPATTAFADIQRLPPAHFLTCDAGGLRVERYWSLELGDPLRYPRAQDYVERFRELLRAAVSDRLRTRRVATCLSGGLDSTSVAATAHQALRSSSAAFDLRAYTEVCDRLFPDQERRYAGLVAQALGIPIHYIVTDDYQLFERWDQIPWRAPEPGVHWWEALFSDKFQLAAGHSRVLLDGNGGDPGFTFSLRLHLLDLLRRGRLLRFLADGATVAIREPRSLARGLWRKLKRPPGPSSWSPYPAWLNEEFAARLELRSRWQRLVSEELPSPHPRAGSFASLTGPFWAHLFENYDPGVTGSLVEVRYPYFDLRVMSYLLAVPPVPWCLRKRLVREAMRGVLPEAVRLRPKAPLGGDPVRTRLAQASPDWAPRLAPLPELGPYVQSDRMPRPQEGKDWGEASWVNLRPLALNLWLHSQARFGYKDAIVSGAPK